MAYRNRTIPDSDHGIRRFVYDFSRTVRANYSAYGLDLADAVLLELRADELIAAMVAAGRPATRTTITVREKNRAKKRVLAVFREYVKKVRVNVAHDELGSGKLVGLDIKPEGRRRKSARPVPVSRPDLIMREIGLGEHVLGYRDTEALLRRGKPRGVTHLVLKRFVGERACGDPAKAAYVGAFTRRPIRMSYGSNDVGRVATYYGAWLTANGEQSPWSVGLSMMIAGVAPPQVARDRGVQGSRDGGMRLAA